MKTIYFFLVISCCSLLVMAGDGPSAKNSGPTRLSVNFDVVEEFSNGQIPDELWKQDFKDVDGDGINDFVHPGSTLRAVNEGKVRRGTYRQGFVINALEGAGAGSGGAGAAAGNVDMGYRYQRKGSVTGGQRKGWQ